MPFVPEDVRLLDTRVLLRRVDTGDEQTVGGILIPEQAHETGDAAEVIAVGPGTLTDEGTRVPVDFVPGDVVLINRYAGTEVISDGSTYLVIREQDVLARVEEEVAS